MGGLLWVALAAAGEPRMEYVTIDSAAERRPMTYGVYKPPGWDGASELPLVVFLHGGGDDETAWDKHPVVTRAFDRWIAEGRLPPFLAVVPDGTKGFWVNWHDGSHRFADWVMDEVIPDARSRYPVAQDASGTHLMGISMGGMGSAFIGLDNLDAFASITVISAPVLDADGMEKLLSSKVAEWWQLDRIVGPADRQKIEARTPYRLDSAGELGDTSLYVAVGKTDMPRLLPANRAWHDHLRSTGVPHRYQEYPGGHQWPAWSKVFVTALCAHLGGDGCDAPPVSTPGTASF